MLQLDWATLLFQIINFLVLVMGLNYLLFKPLRKKLNERESVISDTLQSARDQEAEAAKLRDQWQESTRKAEQEADEILHSAHDGRDARGFPSPAR